MLRGPLPNLPVSLVNIRASANLDFDSWWNIHVWHASTAAHHRWCLFLSYFQRRQSQEYAMHFSFISSLENHTFLVFPKDFLAMIMPVYYRYFLRHHLSFISTRHVLEHLETIAYRYNLIPHSPEKLPYLDRSWRELALTRVGTTTCIGKTCIELPACYLGGQMLCKLQATRGKPLLWAVRNA